MKALLCLLTFLLLGSIHTSAWSPHRTPYRFGDHRFNATTKSEIQLYSTPQLLGLSGSTELNEKSALAVDLILRQTTEYKLVGLVFPPVNDKVKITRFAIGLNYIRLVRLDKAKWSEFTYALGARYASTQSSYSPRNEPEFGPQSNEENMYFHASGKFKKFKPKHEWHLGMRFGYYLINTFNAPTTTPYHWAGKGTFSLDPSVTYLHTFTENSPISLSAELTAGFPLKELTDRYIQEGDTFRSVSTTKYTPFTIAGLLSLNYQF